ncbi:MAG: heme ABC transporter permease CcmB [bacterium]|nr:heme ABC transporter permease CcmB [bacterium]
MSRRISIWIAETATIFRKEWRLELRTRYALNTIALFAFTTLVVVSMTLGPVGASEEARPFLPVLLWLILLFAASAGLPRTFVHEEEAKTAIALRLSAHPSSLFCGKALYNLTLILALELLIAPLYVAMLQMPIASAARLGLTLLAGGYGLAIGSTLIAAMVAQARARGPLFAVLAFPILLPLLKFAVEATIGAVTDEPAQAFLSLIATYDAMLTIAGLMLFPAIWNP